MFSQIHDTISLPIVTDAIDIDVQSTAAPEVNQKNIYAHSSSSRNLDSEDEFTTTEAEETSAESNKSCDELDDRTILQERKPPQDQIKLIMFEDAILNIFSNCSHSGSKCVVTMENQHWIFV